MLTVGSIVALRRARSYASRGDCAFDGVHYGFAAWGIYPLQMAAGLISSLVALCMVAHGTSRAVDSRLDPLFVFRGIFFTLLTLAPFVYVGWSGLSYVGKKGYRKENPGHLGESGTSEFPYLGAVDMALEDWPLDHSTVPRFIGLGGAFVLRTLIDVPGTAFAMAMIHFNVMFSAMICGLAVALAPPAGVLVGVHGVAPALSA
ncbi:hypothetical protein NOR_03541 [Metarhizium rileyi]|uniref:Uncharacterized protein n=1 Tax=Metarhizium rileyi (strain RCEF 4871) TaxID=1649241 RepID=A0A167F4I1_METRR|nr:hypothetical protein NOR_03541 [Metarhizium rileyi RCEF 4871]